MSDNSRRTKLNAIETVDQQSMVVVAAKMLRREILSRDEDDMFLGSEDELVGRLGVSPPTFRQAARLLEFEELLTVKRGVGGGYFGRKPTAAVVARLAGTYLLSQGTTFRDVIRAQAVLEAEVIRLLVEEGSDEDRRALTECLEFDTNFGANNDVARGVRAINRFWQRAGQLSGNNSLTLFMLASQAYGATSAQLRLTPARLKLYAQGVVEMCRAIEARDYARAIAIRSASYHNLMEWVDQEPAGGDGPV
ncbi:MAG: FCD domain-containing protein [Sphingobium sp.]